MRGLRGHIWNLFLIWLMILCSGISLVNAEKLKDHSNICMLYQKEMPITELNALEMQESETAAGGELRFTVWGVRAGVIVENTFLEREAEVSAIPIAGRSDLVLAADVRLDPTDSEGCLVSGDLAYELFGTSAATDRVLTFEGAEYTVRGILEEAENTMVYQCRADAVEETVLDTVTIDVPQDMYKKDVLQEFGQRHEGFEEEAALSIYSTMADLAVMLLPLIMGALIFVPVLKTVYRQRRSPLMLLVAAGGAGFLLLVYFWLVQFRLEIPLDLIPGSWSDFDAWSMTIASQRERIGMVLMAQKREPERILVTYLGQTLRYTVFALFFFIFFIRKIRFSSLNSLYVYGAVSMLASFFTIWYQREDGQMLVRNRGFWFLLIFYFAVGYIYEHKQNIKKFIRTNR